MDRAHSLFLEVKAINEDERVIEGIASTPAPDRQGDVMDPMGAEYTLPMAFLWHHGRKEPVGEVFYAKPTKDGIAIKARVSRVDEPGPVRDRLEEAWQSFKAQPPLVRGLSIDWAPKEYERIPGTNYVRHTKWIWAGLSAVTIPANVEASITRVKELDLAASGPHPPGVSGLPVVTAVKAAKAMKTIPEQISAFEATRASKVAEMNALMTKADGSTLDAADTETYKTLEREVESIDEHLPRLRKLEQTNQKSATPITAKTQEEAAEQRGGTPVITVKSNSNLPKGTAFTRYAMAMAYGKGDMFRTLERAKQWDDSTPEVGFMVKNMDLITKASVYPGTIADATWAAPLAQVQNMMNEFIELLRPATILGRIPNLRKVPFNVSVPTQTAGGTYGWVGEGAPKPVTNLQLGTTTLGIAKAAGIIVLTEELVKLSSPDAEQIVRSDMIAGIAKFLDEQFITPSVAAVTNVSPASITNGTTAVTSAGTSNANAMTDIKALVNAFVSANLSLANAVFIMSETNAFALATAQNALAQPMFPGMPSTLYGRPVITSQSAGTTVALVDAQGILYADDGGVTIDVSREASVEMSTTPTSPNTTSTILVSLWQQNLVGIRAERFINYKRVGIERVKYVAQTYV